MTSSPPMTSSRPYFLRALYEWILDNLLTPYVLINALDERVVAPQEYVSEDGRIVLNITPGIISDLEITNEFIQFKARFGGMSKEVYAPMNAVLAIYAKENGQGMVFPEEPEDSQHFQPQSDAESTSSNQKPPVKGKPNLKVVK